MSEVFDSCVDAVGGHLRASFSYKQGYFKVEIAWLLVMDISVYVPNTP